MAIEFTFHTVTNRCHRHNPRLACKPNAASQLLVFLSLSVIAATTIYVTCENESLGGGPASRRRAPRRSAGASGRDGSIGPAVCGWCWPESTASAPATGPRSPAASGPQSDPVTTPPHDSHVQQRRHRRPAGPLPPAGCDQARYPAGLRIPVRRRPPIRTAVIVQQLLIYGYTATDVLTY